MERVDKKEKAKKKGSKLPFSKEKATRKGSDPADLAHHIKEKTSTNLESESDQLDNSSLKEDITKKNSQPFSNFVRKKDVNNRKIPDNFVLWLRIDDYDAVPIKVDSSLTV
jgi:hypothetical protein